MRLLTSILVAVLMISAGAQCQAVEDHQLAVRLVHPDAQRIIHGEAPPNPEFAAVNAPSQPGSIDGKTLYVKKRPEVTEKDISAVSIEEKGSEVQLRARLSSEAAKRLATVARDNKEQRIAIVLAGGQVVGAPTLGDVNQSGEIVFSVPMRKKEAEALRARLLDR